MQSTELCLANQHGDSITFPNWFTLEEAIKQAPRERGVYIWRVRGGRKLNRVNGESDIVYIGSSKNLKRRLQQYARPIRKPSSPTGRIRRFSELYPLEVSFAITPMQQKPTFYETIAMQLYWADHHEFPPVNHSTVVEHLIGAALSRN